MENIIRDLQNIDITVTENVMIDRIKEKLNKSDLYGILKLIADVSANSANVDQDKKILIKSISSNNLIG